MNRRGALSFLLMLINLFLQLKRSSSSFKAMGRICPVLAGIEFLWLLKYPTGTVCSSIKLFPFFLRRKMTNYSYSFCMPCLVLAPYLFAFESYPIALPLPERCCNPQYVTLLRLGLNPKSFKSHNLWSILSMILVFVFPCLLGGWVLLPWGITCMLLWYHSYCFVIVACDFPKGSHIDKQLQTNSP